MKKFVLLFKMSLVLQVFEKNEYQLIFDSIKYIFLFFCMVMAMGIMMLIPVFLFYAMLDNFTNMRKYNNKIDFEICCKEDNLKSNYLKSICQKYLKSHSNFFKYFSALAAWNIFSFIYIIYGFESFAIGLKEYFYFPFNILQALNKEEIFDTIIVFKSNYIFMIIIVLLTFSFYHIGKYLGQFVAKENIKKRNLFFLKN